MGREWGCGTHGETFSWLEGLLSLAVTMDVRGINKSGFRKQNTKKPREIDEERECGEDLEIL